MRRPWCKQLARRRGQTLTRSSNGTPQTRMQWPLPQHPMPRRSCLRASPHRRSRSFARSRRHYQPPVLAQTPMKCYSHLSTLDILTRKTSTIWWQRRQSIEGNPPTPIWSLFGNCSYDFQSTWDPGIAEHLVLPNHCTRTSTRTTGAVGTADNYLLLDAQSFSFYPL